VGVADAEGSDVALGVPVGDAEAVAVADGVLVAEAEELGVPVALDDTVDVGEPEHGVADAVVSARPGLAGTTSRAPIATVPVATAPTIDTADRFLRVCFGTVQPPAFADFPCIRIMRRAGRTVPP
jgi:hypothetical protein